MLNDAYAFAIGPLPILLSTVCAYVYCSDIITKKSDIWRNIASAFFISSFSVSIFFYLLGNITTQHLIASQILATALFFILVKIALVFPENPPERVLVQFKQSPGQFLSIVLVSPIAIIVCDYFLAHVVPKCVGPKCYIFDFLFGYDLMFSRYYVAGLGASMLLICGVISVRNFSLRRFGGE
ncbi:hypothetical protein [Rhizobium grahamii]|uniref:Transmembrane protein n=1 Tax=Rhizobium grahamii CCGE 502 TaxID=990285 RepID=S3HHX7_9HYPH|nr:hypothetical protein [Rhizobium grahamii]EPE98432.1 hypothetical protein RGCCGE502_08395 [Rhizobium grahamii CCGE 502]